MAQRRMFSLKIVDSDAFLDMPLSTQALYFHLSMRGDDDGFVGNPKKIMRLTNCNDDDMKVLFSKRFILPFESGICVIKHWKIHNYIQKDRYTETTYTDEKKQLVTKENNAYSLDKNKCIQNVSRMETQVRLGKVRKEKSISSDEEFLKDLKANPAYKGIHIEAELGKMDAWLSTRPGRKKTRRFIVNWLNKVEPIVGDALRRELPKQQQSFGPRGTPSIVTEIMNQKKKLQNAKK